MGVCNLIIDGLEKERDALRSENASLREKMESHAPDGHNVTNYQYFNLREERDELRELVKEGLALMEASEKSKRTLKYERRRDAFLRKAREVVG